MSGLNVAALEKLGYSYLIEHCVSWLKEENRHHAWESYIAECCRLMVRNQAVQPGERQYISVKYTELIERSRPPKKQKTADEIIGGMKAKMERMREEDEANEHDGV